jgi:orotidine-5'-phosphate decarboxylase
MVGLDPRWEQLPEDVRHWAVGEHGATLEAVAAAYGRFCTGVIDQVADLVPIVKFQAAFFEAAGPAGLQVLWELIRVARDAGLLVVLDGKRNDIGSTAEAYAAAYLGAATVEGARLAVWSADALTVNPYLGAEGIEPFLRTARAHVTGIFVLVRTSNPGAGRLQDLLVGDQAIYQRIADWVEEWSAAAVGEYGYGPVGAVVGATVPAQVAELRRRMPHVVLLIPGYGAQGGSAADVATAFDARGFGAVVNNSRGILYAFQEPAYAGQDWPAAVRSATLKMIADLAAHRSFGRSIF